MGNIKSGGESDDKKVTEESDSEKEKIDILGFLGKRTGRIPEEFRYNLGKD